MSLNLQKGIAMTSVLMWAVGISIPIGLFLAKANSETNTSQDKIIVSHEARISVVETRLERLPIIERKLDALLEKQGVNYLKDASPAGLQAKSSPNQ